MTTEILGASAATLFYTEGDNSRLTHYLSQVWGKPVADDWYEVTLTVAAGEMKLTKMKFAPGNKVAVTILKIFNFIKNRYGDAVRSDSRVDHLLKADYAVGIVFDPAIERGDQRIGVLQEIVQVTSAVIFDGATLLDPSLDPL